jgi:hypothetical protein
MSDASPLSGHLAQVFPAEALFVAHGVNLDDALGPPAEVVMGDVYALDDRARPLRLMLAREGGAARVAPGSQVGAEGEGVATLARYTLMSQGGERVELLLLSVGAARYVLPLSPLSAQDDYTLVQAEAAPEETRLSDLMCLSFARGTLVALASGAQKAVEALVPGDRLLTRDHGPQPLRWIGRATLRAVGAFAPVVITAGTLGNAGDLIVSQHHRMFLYQRDRRPDLGAAELLVQAKHLVDGENVFVREGGVVDYFALVFDRHEIIYAEGIPAESLMVSEATIRRLPPEVAEAVARTFPGLSQVQHFGLEAGRAAVERLGPAALYQTRRPRRPRG